jgi:hypothetical protein
MVLAYVSVYISFGIFIFVAAMYFMPRLGIVKKEEQMSIPEIIADDLYKVEGKIEDAIVEKIMGAKEGTKPEAKETPKKSDTPKKPDSPAS